MLPERAAERTAERTAEREQVDGLTGAIHISLRIRQDLTPLAVNNNAEEKGTIHSWRAMKPYQYFVDWQQRRKQVWGLWPPSTIP